MAYDRRIYVQGIETIDTETVNISFEYVSGVAPETVNFNITSPTMLTVYGTCSKTEITTYNVTGGIITDEFMEKVKIKCIAALTNYDTI